MFKSKPTYRVDFLTGPPLKSTKKLISARLGVSRTIYVNVDTPNLGFTYFNFLGGDQLKKPPCMTPDGDENGVRTKFQN